MAVYKYVSQAAAIRYLSSWAFRLTPPDQFNDPFELRPRFTALTQDSLRRLAPQAIKEEFQKMLPPLLSANGVANVNMPMVEAFVSFLLGELDDDRLAAFVSQVESSAGVGVLVMLDGFRKQFAEQMKDQLESVASLLPSLNRQMESVMHTTLHRLVGIVCLSRSGKNALMWSHYADSHQGALLEFDEGHSTFRRRRSAVDEFGSLRRVSYSDTRPEIGADVTDEDAFVHLALTKALEWSYEQEVRLLWPLQDADRIVESGDINVHLIDIPPSAFRSITFGCKATKAFARDAVGILGQVADTSHVIVRRAVIDDTQYALNYIQAE